MRLLLLFLIVPILEIVVFIGVNNYIGLIYTIILVLLTATIGTLIVKRQGFQVISNFRNQVVTQTGNPLILLVNGFIILVAGVLLLTPGFITDSFGFSLLIPKLRGIIIKEAIKRIKPQTTDLKVDYEINL